jgi:hypothetical protein
MQAIDDQGEVNERDEHDIEFVKPREEARKSLEPAEQPFDLSASFIDGSLIFPWYEAILLGRHHRNIS